MKPVGRQAPIKLSFLCKIPWMQKFQLDTGHFLWTWQCIFICNSAVTPSSGAWLCLVPGCAPCRPVAVKSSRWRRPVMRSGARVTLNIGHAHFTQAPDPSPTLIFILSLAKRSFFIDFLLLMSLFPQDSLSVVNVPVQDTKECFQQIGNWFLSTGDKHSQVDINDDVSPGIFLYLICLFVICCL